MEIKKQAEEKEERERLAIIEREKIQLEREKLEAQKVRDEREVDIQDEFRRDQLKIQKERLDLERTRNEAKVFKLKQYGDAIRNSMSKMGENSPLEFLPFIKNFERLLKELSVPSELYVFDTVFVRKESVIN